MGDHPEPKSSADNDRSAFALNQLITLAKTTTQPREILQAAAELLESFVPDSQFRLSRSKGNTEPVKRIEEVINHLYDEVDGLEPSGPDNSPIARPDSPASAHGQAKGASRKSSQ